MLLRRNSEGPSLICSSLPWQGEDGKEDVPDQVRGIDAFCVVVQQATQQNDEETSYCRKACQKWLRSGPLIVEWVGMKLVLVPCQ